MAAFEVVSVAKLKQKLQAAAGHRFVLIDFFAEANCEPCTSSRALTAIEGSYESAWDLLRLNVDSAESATVLAEYKIFGIPTLMLVRPDGERSKFVELPDKDAENILKWLEKEVPQQGQRQPGPSTRDCS